MKKVKKMFGGGMGAALGAAAAKAGMRPSGPAPTTGGPKPMGTISAGRPSAMPPGVKRPNLGGLGGSGGLPPDRGMGGAKPSGLGAASNTMQQLQSVLKGSPTNAKYMKKGGKVSSASKRADGVATKGKTKGRII